MRSIRLIAIVIVLITGVCTIPSLLPAEFSGKADRSNYDLLSEPQQMDNGGAIDLTTCQNGCRMRYGPAPSTGHGIMGDSVATAPADEPGESVEHSSPALYIQCVEECERNYWAQFEKEASGSRRSR
jgi:hypothetical protein